MSKSNAPGGAVTSAPCIYHTSNCTLVKGRPEDHGPYCLHFVGRGVIGFAAPDSDGKDTEMEVAVATASLTNPPGDGTDLEFNQVANRHHDNVVQVSMWLPDDTDVRVDFQPGEARSLAALLQHAADRADGIR